MTETKTNQVKSPKSIKTNESKRVQVEQPSKSSKQKKSDRLTKKTSPKSTPPLPGSNKKPERPAITTEFVDELRDMAKDGKIKKEIFLEYLKEKDLLDKKKEVVSRLATYNIKIMRKKNILKPERLKIYNDFLTQHKKELRSIVRRAKKNFGIVESTFIYNLFDNETEFKKNLKLLKHYLKENEIKIIKVPRAKIVKQNLERVKSSETRYASI